MSNDLISRQDAIDAVKGRFSMPVDNLIVEVIGALPSAQQTIDAVEVKHGEWIETDDFDELIKGSVVCSNCRGQYQSLIIRNNEIEMRANKTPYCPNCGAKMDGDLTQSNDSNVLGALEGKEKNDG